MLSCYCLMAAAIRSFRKHQHKIHKKGRSKKNNVTSQLHGMSSFFFQLNILNVCCFQGTFKIHCYGFIVSLHVCICYVIYDCFNNFHFFLFALFGEVYCVLVLLVTLLSFQLYTLYGVYENYAFSQFRLLHFLCLCRARISRCCFSLFF